MTISESRAQYAVAQDFRAQAASAFQELVRAGRDGAIHPIAWPAFFHAAKMNALNFEVLANQFIKINAARHDIATD